MNEISKFYSENNIDIQHLNAFAKCQRRERFSKKEKLFYTVLKEIIVDYNGITYQFII